MSLDKMEYIEVSLIGITLLTSIMAIDFKNHRSTKTEGHCHFVRMLSYNTCILAADIGIALSSGYSAPWIGFLDNLFCICFFALHSWFSYEWIRYVMARICARYRLSRKVQLLLLLPALASTLTVLLTPLTGWVYTLTDDNIYHRGPYMLITFISSLIYLLAATIIIYREYRNPRACRKPDEYLWLLFIPVPMLIGNILQLKLYGLSIVWVASAISMMILYAEIQNSQLSLDALTGVYNRRQTDAQLRWEVGKLPECDDFLLVAMIDIDHFKQINDRFGHLRGDEALTVAAAALTANCRRTDFIGRFGGDEFLIIGHVTSAQNADAIFHRVAQDLNRHNDRCPYRLSLSFGYVLCNSQDLRNADQILDEADKRMYQAKQLKSPGPQA